MNFFVTLSFSTPPFSSRSFSLTLGLFCLLLKGFFLCVLLHPAAFLKIETRKLFRLFCINPAARRRHLKTQNGNLLSKVVMNSLVKAPPQHTEENGLAGLHPFDSSSFCLDFPIKPFSLLLGCLQKQYFGWLPSVSQSVE